MDEVELGRLYGRYGYAVFRHCVAFVGVEEAQQVVHEVFVRGLREGVEGEPRSWLCRCADGLCAERLRARPRAPSVSTEASGFLPAGTAAVAGAGAPLDAEALARAVGDDDREALLTVQRLLVRLEPGLRRLAVLYYLDELSEEELAHELGWSRRVLDKRFALLLAQAGVLFRGREAS